MMPAEDPLKLLANPANRALIARLAQSPSYPRALAVDLGLTEGEVQRKLHRLERAGIVTGAWRFRGKTVKEYVLRASGLDIDFSTGTIEVRVMATEA